VNRLLHAVARGTMVAGLLHGGGSELPAQTVGGMVVGDSSRNPLSKVRVHLLDSASAATVDSAITDSVGIFYLNARRPGVYSVVFLRTGAVPRSAGRWGLAADSVQLATFVLPEGIERTAYTEADVDKPGALVPRNPAPRYPQALRDKGINGNARIRFIIDTTGRLVPESFTVLFATAPEFVDAIRAVMGDWRFFPAQKGGVAVREVVCMPLTFRVQLANAGALDAQWREWYAHPSCPMSQSP
jgi:TonB family protein